MNITKGQITIIHVAKHKLGLDDDIYRGMLREMFGVNSSTGLSYSQAKELIEHLKSCGFRVLRKERASGENIIKLTSPAEHRLIGVLSKRFTWRVRDGFQLWIERQRVNGHIHSTSLNEAQDARWVIEKLKQMTRTSSSNIARREVPHEQMG